jgi:hypothetical protein
MPRTLPQPHEGITGISRDDWLLSLDERAVAHREALIIMARHLSTATLVGQPAPVVRRMSRRMADPRAGDLAVTTEVLYGRQVAGDRIKGFGILLAHRQEWGEPDTSWAATCLREGWNPVTEERYAETACYLQYGCRASDVCRWVNSLPVALPAWISSFNLDAAAERSETGVTFTRDSLITGLADSGFTLRGPERL